MSPARYIAHSKPSEIDWKYGEPIAESPARNTGELANGWSLRPGGEPLPVGRVAGPVEVQRDPDDLEVADDLAVRLLLDLVDEAVHRLRRRRGSCSRSHSPSNRGGIASYSSAVMLTMPVTWLTLPS